MLVLVEKFYLHDISMFLFQEICSSDFLILCMKVEDYKYSKCCMLVLVENVYLHDIFMFSFQEICLSDFLILCMKVEDYKYSKCCMLVLVENVYLHDIFMFSFQEICLSEFTYVWYEVRGAGLLESSVFVQMEKPAIPLFGKMFLVTACALPQYLS